MADTQGGAMPRGTKIHELTEATALTLDLNKYSGGVFALSVSAACALTIKNAPIGWTEIRIILTNPGTDFSITNTVKEPGGTEPTYTVSGVDILTLGIHCTAVATDGTITGDIYQLAIAQDVKD